MGDKTRFTSRHFNLEQLAEGVYAAINTEQGWAICNAGIIDLGDRTLVYDSFLSPEAARDLRDAAEGLTGRPVHAVINSHPHNDHIWGNQVFSADVDIISTTRTRELIATEGLAEVQEYRQITPTRLEAVQAQFAEAHDETTRKQLKFYITYFQAIVTTLPELQIRLPNLTFTGELGFNGTNRSARIFAIEGGHSGSDAILFLPDDGIAFMSDLLFIGIHPYLPDGDPEKIRRIMGEVRNLQPKILVPGHGPVGQISHLDGMEEYIDTLEALVKKAIKMGVTVGQIEQLSIPTKYQNLIYPSFFLDNMKFLYKRQMASAAGLVE